MIYDMDHGRSVYNLLQIIKLQSYTLLHNAPDSCCQFCLFYWMQVLCARVHHNDFERIDRGFHPSPSPWEILHAVASAWICGCPARLPSPPLYISRFLATLRTCQDDKRMLVSSVHIGRCSNRTLLCHILTISRQFQDKSTMSPLQAPVQVITPKQSYAHEDHKCGWSTFEVQAMLGQGLECQPPAVLHSVWVDIFGEIPPPFLSKMLWTRYSDWFTDIVQSKSI